MQKENTKHGLHISQKKKQWTLNVYRKYIFTAPNVSFVHVNTVYS